MKIFFKTILSYPPTIAGRNSLTNQFYQKFKFLDILTTKKVQNWKTVEEGPGKTGHFFLLLKISRNLIFFSVKLISR